MKLDKVSKIASRTNITWPDSATSHCHFKKTSPNNNQVTRRPLLRSQSLKLMKVPDCLVETAQCSTKKLCWAVWVPETPGQALDPGFFKVRELHQASSKQKHLIVLLTMSVKSGLLTTTPTLAGKAKGWS